MLGNVEAGPVSRLPPVVEVSFESLVPHPTNSTPHIASTVPLGIDPFMTHSLFR